jgi:imidazolonepropionase-like amidohydrolase
MRTVFGGGRVFEPRDGTLTAADVVVEDGRVAEVGPGLDGDRRIDVAGKALLPGLFDCHIHLLLTTIDQWHVLQTPLSYRFYQAARNMRATLARGITTVRDAGGADLGMQRAQADGLIPGPRMLISIKMMSQTGGHGDHWVASGAEVSLFVEYPGSPSGVVDGPDEVRRKVRELIRDGANVIKVCSSGGVLSARDDPRNPQFGLDELTAIVNEAAAAGRWVMAHAQSTAGIKNALRAGVRSIDHGIYLDDEAIDLMLARGAYLVPTLVAPQGVIDAAAAGAQIHEASLQKAREVVEAHRDSFRRAVAAGVRVAMGTDSPVSPHGQNLRELVLMNDGGMTPAQVLRASTLTAAELCGLEDELGALEPGKRADLVVVDGDPFDLRTLPDRIAAVWQDGVQVAGPELAAAS